MIELIEDNEKPGGKSPFDCFEFIQDWGDVKFEPKYSEPPSKLVFVEGRIARNHAEFLFGNAQISFSGFFEGRKSGGGV
jgi:hypothetical protein